MIFLKPSLYGFKNEHSLSADYAVENCGNLFYIHRVVPITERFFYSRDQLLITPEGQYLLPKIKECFSLEEAKSIVQAYWETVSCEHILQRSYSS